MKATLFLTLISLIFCQTGFSGGWVKRSLAENNLYLDRSFTSAFMEYSEAKNSKNEDYIRLTIYSQVVAGVNYKVCFYDPNSEKPVVQEYIVYVPITSWKKGPIFRITKHSEYPAEKSLNANDESFSLAEKQLTQGLENTNEKVKSVSSILTAENGESIFYIITAETENGEHQYIIAQDKADKKFDYANKIR